MFASFLKQCISFVRITVFPNVASSTCHIEMIEMWLPQPWHIFVYVGAEGYDEAMLNMIMHSLGKVTPRNSLTGSTAKNPQAENYPPEGTCIFFLLNDSFA